MKKIIYFLLLLSLLPICMACDKEYPIVDKFHKYNINIPNSDTIRVQPSGQTIDMYTDTKNDYGKLYQVFIRCYYQKGENSGVSVAKYYYEDEIIKWTHHLSESSGVLEIKPNLSGNQRTLTFYVFGGLLTDESIFTIIQDSE